MNMQAVAQLSSPVVARTQSAYVAWISALAQFYVAPVRSEHKCVIKAPSAMYLEC